VEGLVVGAMVAVAGIAELVASAGQGSPGCSMKVELPASSFCVASEVVALGLMT
jgi:hypothetical protein